MKSTDYKILLRETKRYGAQFAWYKDSRNLEIFISARKGSVWTCNQEPIIELIIPNPTPESMREGVQDLLESIQFGYIRLQNLEKHENTCECSKCESYDSELGPELNFA